MHLLLLNYEYPPIGGGGGFGCEKLVQALAKHAGYEVTVLTAGIGSQTTEETDPFGVKIIRVPCASTRAHRSSASFLFMLTYIIRATLYVWKKRQEWRGHFDVISTQFAIPTGPAGWAIAKILQTPNILTLHGGELFSQPLELDGYGFAIRAIVRFFTNHCDRIHANSQDTRNAAIRFLGITKPITVISTGFSAPIEVLPERTLHPKPENKPIELVMVSRLVERKGLGYLIEALSHIPAGKWRLTLVGDGPEETNLKNQAQKKNILSRMTFTGFVSEKEKFAHLANADVFVLPTLHEGLGLVYFEAMYAGLPIITTNNGGQTDFLENEQNALLTPIKDVTALIKALERGINDADWRRSCGDNNRRKINDLMVAKLVPEYDALFRNPHLH